MSEARLRIYSGLDLQVRFLALFFILTCSDRMMQTGNNGPETNVGGHLPPAPAFCPACGVAVHAQASLCHRCGVVIQQHVPSPQQVAQTGQPLMAGTPPDYFRPPNPGAVIAGWILFVLCLIPYVGLIFLLPLWIVLGIDARRIGCDDLRFSSLELGYFERQSTSTWVAGFIVLGMIYIPAYLALRNRMARAAHETIKYQLLMSAEEQQAIKRKTMINNIVVYSILGTLLIGLAVLFFSISSI